jgi:hypothetical protein
MKPLIKLDDGTLLVTSAIGAVTSTGRFRKEAGIEKQIRETRVLSVSGSLLYEFVSVIDKTHMDAISNAASAHRAIVEAVETALL